jgi:LPS-assembly lipoprotein
LAALAATVLGLAACQVRPLYGAGPQGASPQHELPAIAVDPPVTRQEQLFRNALNFGLQGGAGAAPARYHLIYRLTIRETDIAVERRTGRPSAYQLNGSVSVLLRDIATGEEILGTSVTAIDSYNRSSQSFANVRAERDAEERLVETLAQLVEARLAAFFATR